MSNAFIMIEKSMYYSFYVWKQTFHLYWKSNAKKNLYWSKLPTQHNV